MFRPSRTQWAVSLAEDEAVTHQEHSQILHSWRQATCATFGLCVSLQHLLPSSLHEESVRQRRSSNTHRRKRSAMR